MYTPPLSRNATISAVTANSREKVVAVPPLADVYPKLKSVVMIVA